MHVVGIIGSPRQGSVSSTLLRDALQIMEESGWSSSTFDACTTDIEFCTACGACEAEGQCRHNDTLAQFMISDFARADAVLVASPVFFFNVSAQLKRFFDRCQPWWVRRFRLHMSPPVTRPCGLIAAAGAAESPKLFTCVESAMRCFANTMGLGSPHNLLVSGTDNSNNSRLNHLRQQARELGLQLLKEA